MTTTTAPAPLASAAVRAVRAALPTCRACGRRGVTNTTLCTGRVIASCPWCGHERVLPVVTDGALAVGMLPAAVEGFLF